MIRQASSGTIGSSAVCSFVGVSFTAVAEAPAVANIREDQDRVSCKMT